MSEKRLTRQCYFDDFCETVDCPRKYIEELDCSIPDCENCYYNLIYTRLSELEDKIESGLLVELPCKVGDTVYEIVWHYKWVGFRRVLVPDIIESFFDLDILGSYKTMWFLTEEEAEARLKELQEGKK